VAADFIPLATPDLRGREREYLVQCVDDNWVSSAGPFVEEIERRMAVLAGREHAVATVSGTTALQLALRAFEIQSEEDLVVVPDWSFAATANSVYHAGATPLFVDVTHETWSLDPTLLARVFDERGQAIKGVIGVDALGHPAAWQDLEALCNKHGVPLIEDAAGALGSTAWGRPAGSFGQAACFSFNGNKLVTSGGGGMLVTDDARIAARARHLSTQARSGEDYVHDDIGFNYRMPNINAAVGLAQLERLDEVVSAKRSIAARYNEEVSKMEGLTPMPCADWADPNCWLYSLLLPCEEDAQTLIGALRKDRIQARVFWRSLSRQDPYRSAPKHLSDVSAGLSGRVVSLPCSSHLTAEDQSRVIGVMASWHEGRLANTKH
jgi:dTDP-4-amino-4,6-dideoxygalactose transaminase